MKNYKFLLKISFTMLFVSLVVFWGIKTVKASYIIGLDFREIRCFESKIYCIKKNSFEKDDIYIAFTADKRFPPYVKEGDVIFKRIVGRKNDELKTDGRDFYLNGEYLGTARETDSKGKSIKHFSYSGKIPSVSYFVMGTHELSYDSRYYGFITRDQIIGGGKPLW